MQYIVLFCLLYLLIIELTVNVTSMAPIIRNGDNEKHRIIVTRRLRAPLMGRSIATTKALDGDGVHLADSSSHNVDEDEIISLGKRRYSFAVLGGRRWVTSKKRGPLFG